MDLAFFGLREPPFDPTPNPAFLYPTPVHREALAQLLYGVERRKGFLLLTGEVGTGKTLLVRALLERLRGGTATALVTGGMLGFEGILEYVLEDLGVAKPGETPAQRLFALQHFLVERQRAGQNTLLVLDEAQDLGADTLERIRLLSNFETSREKVLQILLVGQPELRARLALPELRQLEQRIAIRARVGPLDAAQVREYVRARLAVAGAPDPGLFAPAALARIAAYSGGIPRLVNALCDHCLVFAYADQVRRVGPETVDEAARYMDDAPGRRRRARARRRPRARRGARALALAATATAALVAAVGLADPGLLPEPARPLASAIGDLVRAWWPGTAR